jgi:3-oxoacyl-[acyl-carrier protein] reductase
MSQRIAVVTGGSRGLGKSTVLALALAKELDLRGVTVNSILPTATEGAGVSAKQVRPQVREFIKNNNPMQRMATLEDVANAAEYLAGELSAYVSGQHLVLSGGAPA